jgi:hypothetical protein
VEIANRRIATILRRILGNLKAEKPPVVEPPRDPLPDNPPVELPPGPDESPNPIPDEAPPRVQMGVG